MKCKSHPDPTESDRVTLVIGGGLTADQSHRLDLSAWGVPRDRLDPAFHAPAAVPVDGAFFATSRNCTTSADF